jgi:hypothetical protein
VDPSLEAMFAEYGVLRAEISRRVGYQLLILGVNVALVAAVISASDRLGALGGSLFLLVAPLLLCVVGVFYFDQDRLITDVASYLEQDLRRRLHVRVAQVSTDHPIPHLWRWETFRYGLLSPRGGTPRGLLLTAGFRALAGCGPTAGSIIGVGVSYAWKSQSAGFKAAGAGLLFIDVLALVGLCSLALQVKGMYRRVLGAPVARATQDWPRDARQL